MNRSVEVERISDLVGDSVLPKFFAVALRDAIGAIADIDGLRENVTRDPQRHVLLGIFAAQTNWRR